MCDERSALALDGGGGGTMGQGQQGQGQQRGRRAPFGCCPHHNSMPQVPYEQSREAVDQWTRLLDGLASISSKSKTTATASTPLGPSALVDRLGPFGCCGALGRNSALRGLGAGVSRSAIRQSVDPGLVRLVLAETELLKETTSHPHHPHPHPPQLNCGLDGCEQFGEDALDRRRLGALPPPGGPGIREGGGGGGLTKEFDDNSPFCYNEMTPWKDPGKCYSLGLMGLHEEIEDFYGYMLPLPEEQFMRQGIVRRLEKIVQDLWPAAEVKVFGSFKTNLYLPTSDIDLVVMCDDIDPQAALKMLEQKLTEKNVYDDVKVIKTSVPIVKFTDQKTAVKVDVSFNVQTGISSADFIQSMMAEYSELPYLVLVLKQFLLARNLLESFNGGISSYCLILLIISYLQLHPDDRKTGNHGDMLIKFLELYGRHFNYLRTGIRIGNGGAYFRKNENEGELGNRFSLLCIEDPFNPANDVGQGCYGAMKVREEFDKAYRELSDAVLPQYQHIQPVGSSFLGRILLMPPEVILYRRLIREKYRRSPVATQTPAISPLESSVATIVDDNRSDDAGSTCSQNSNQSSGEQQTTKSSSSGSSSSVSPASSLPSETESEFQSDGIARNLVQNSRMKYSAASFEPASADMISSHAVDGELFLQQPQMTNIVVSGSNSAFLHPHQPPSLHLPPSTAIVDQTLPPPPPTHPGQHTSGRSNSWHNTTRSQGLKSGAASSQRAVHASVTVAPPGAGPPSAAGNPTGGSKIFTQTSRYGNDRQRRPNNSRHENNNPRGGGGFVSNR